MSARHDPVIRLHHTGRTIMARFKYDTNLQNLARWVGSTCHDGLLASEIWEIDWRAPRGAGHPETHPHTRDAVVYAECSSRTLAPGLQLCKECTNSSLGCPCIRRREEANFDHSCFQPVTQCGGEYGQFGQQWAVVNIVKASADVCVEDPRTCVLATGRRENSLNRIHRTASWSKSIGVRLKARLPFRFQGRFDDCLHHPVLPGRDPLSTLPHFPSYTLRCFR